MLSDLKNRMGTLAVASVAIVGLSMAPFGGTSALGATFTWTGNGDKTTFSDPANWDSLPPNDSTADLIATEPSIKQFRTQTDLKRHATA